MKSIVLFCFLALGLIVTECSNGKSAVENEKTGQEKFNKGQKKEAYKYFKTAASQDPENAQYQWYAAQTAPNQNAAFIHTKNAWEHGFCNPVSLMALTQLSLHTELSEKLKFTLDLFGQLPDSFKTNEFKGEIFYGFAQYDSALALWGPIYASAPSSNLCDKIAIAYDKKDLPAMDDQTLTTGMNRGVLDNRGYLLLAALCARDYNYARIDTIFAQATHRGILNDTFTLEKAPYLIVTQKYDMARKFLEKIGASDDQILALRSRLLLGYQFFLLGNADSLKSLAAFVPRQSKFKTPELKLYSLAAGFLQGDTAISQAQLLDAGRRLPVNPLVSLLTARVYVRDQAPAKAIEQYQALPLLFLSSPRLLPEFGAVLSQKGYDDQALALVSRMNEKKIFNRLSLELFRDITFKKQLVDKSMAAQKILEQKYPDDVRIKWSKAVMALKTGKIDSALAVITGLAGKHPEEPNFEIARLSLCLIKGPPQRAIDECAASTAPVYAVKAIEARAYRKMGQLKKAALSYEAGLADRKTPSLAVEYADMLINAGQNAKAAQLYESIIPGKNSMHANADSAEIALVLNNFAWALLQGDPQHYKTALSSAGQARKLLPGNLHILDTYACALLKNKKYKECAEVLEGRTELSTEPNLTLRLAEAYDNLNDFNKAVRLYNEALNSPDSVALSAIAADRNQIRRRVETLLTK
jgi:uncharacterized protein HemY